MQAEAPFMTRRSTKYFLLVMVALARPPGRKELYLNITTLSSRSELTQPAPRCMWRPQNGEEFPEKYLATIGVEVKAGAPGLPLQCEVQRVYMFIAIHPTH